MQTGLLSSFENLIIPTFINTQQHQTHILDVIKLSELANIIFEDLNHFDLFNFSHTSHIFFSLSIPLNYLNAFEVVRPDLNYLNPLNIFDVPEQSLDVSRLNSHAKLTKNAWTIFPQFKKLTQACFSEIDFDHFFLQNSLKRLTLEDCKISLQAENDICKLPQLEDLTLVSISEISFEIFDSINLKKLFMLNTHIKNTDCFHNLKLLKNLTILFCEIKSLNFLSELTKLEKLNLSFSSVIDLRPLNYLTCLKTLQFSGYTDLDFSIIEDLPLTHLEIGTILGFMQPSNTNTISKLTDLKSLNLRTMNVDKYNFLPQLTQLEELTIYDCPLNKYDMLTNFSNLTNLKKLELHLTHYEEIRDCTNYSLFKSLTKLEYIFLKIYNQNDFIKYIEINSINESI